MKEHEALELLADAMVILFTEIEALKAEITGTSNEQYQNYLDELRKLQEQLESPNKFVPTISQLRFFQVVRIMHKPRCISVFEHYPKFKEDLIKLLAFRYISETKNGLEWKKSTKSLAEYFGHQVEENENKQWAVVENLFDKKGLKDSFKNAKEKSSKDYEKLIELLDDDPPKSG
ncbi:MAG: hypothetical protein LBH16_09875 [Treponema sp.]|jgi:hypothetical protein|nr:hypothetical protein [Treponema sp.]